MRSDGVIYQLSGPKHLQTIEISIWSLRKHYDGPVTIFATRDCYEQASQISRWAKTWVQVIRSPKYFPNIRNFDQVAHCLAKTATNMLTPYDRNVFLDADTIVRSKIDELFQYDLAFVGIRSDGDLMKLMDDNQESRARQRKLRRVRQAIPSLERMVHAALAANPPCCNCGVYVFSKTHPLISQWHCLALACASLQITDEPLLMLAMPSWMSQVVILDDCWNAIRGFTKDYWDARIRHFIDGEWQRSMEWKKEQIEFHQSLGSALIHYERNPIHPV